LSKRRESLHSKVQIKVSAASVIVILGVFAWALALCVAEEREKGKDAEKRPNSPGNSLCYVCHVDLQSEQITTVHLAEGIGCVRCHGSSSHHMHDEMLMTKPDILYGRTEVEQMCKGCHRGHKKPESVEAFRKEWSGRTRPNGRAVGEESICTDCHGTHNIVKRMGTKSEDESREWVPVFNAVNLDNWQVLGRASWKVERSSIVARPASKGKGGELWTKEVYGDYLLSVTFRSSWPIEAGIWLRGGNGNPGPRVEIFESGERKAFTGSVRVADGSLALVNMRPDVFEPESWNTISVKVEGDRIQVWLNGEEVGAVRVKGAAEGRIGLHLASSAAYKSAELRVREVLVQRLGESRK
jgi:hypothetical protein